jgi:hypothetical protein
MLLLASCGILIVWRVIEAYSLAWPTTIMPTTNVAFARSGSMVSARACKFD